ncbi:MAG: hypothetical protein JWO10_2208 [Microbacteriaceae bacterium]|nr:hypothetical protein [Microbacteriaceae bacterium]
MRFISVVTVLGTLALLAMGVAVVLVGLAELGLVAIPALGSGFLGKP